MPQPPTDEPNILVLWGLGFAVFALLIFLLWLNHAIVSRGHPKSETAPPAAPPIQAPPRPSIGDVIMSRLQGSAGPVADMRPVHIPVSGMERGPGGIAGMPDMGAEKPIGSQSAEDDITEPRVSSYLTDQEFFIFLVMQRKGNEYRLSANKIHQIVGGDRNEVLARIRGLRAGPTTPRYQALDEQHRAMGVAPEKV